VLAGFAPAYPVEDVRPLVAAVERERRADEPLVVYPSTIWAYALYSRSAVSIEPDEGPWGFRPAVNDASVILLDAHRDVPQQYAAPVTEAVGGSATAWLLVSHRRVDLGAITAAFSASGLREDGGFSAPGADLTRWKRTP
jgi:hypothetical protein